VKNSILFKMFTSRNFICFSYLAQHYGI